MRKNDSCLIHPEIRKSLPFKLIGLESLAGQIGQFTKVSRVVIPFFSYHPVLWNKKSLALFLHSLRMKLT